MKLSSFCTDSRIVKQGDIFVAIPCNDVIQHISEALIKGAKLIFTQEYYSWINNNKIVLVNDTRLLASKLASFYYPKQPKINIAITGTNGKSSVAHFLSQMLLLCNIKSANLGTLGLFINGIKTTPENITIPNLTTPDPSNLHKILNYLSENNINNLVFEASSAALDQKRLHSVNLTTAAFTNLASDHLDYHKSYEDYLNSKLLLFKDILKQDKTAVVFGDDEYLYNKVKNIHSNIITYGFNKNNNIYASNINSNIDAIKFDLFINNKIFRNLELHLTGEFQLLNVLCAISLLYVIGIDIEKIVKVLDKLTALQGRMERIHNNTIENNPINNKDITHNIIESKTTNNDEIIHNNIINKTILHPNIFIDYAHTSEGFRTALLTLKKYCKGKLICVFGCGGNRDATKRKEFGSIANELVDISIITDDNPRNEDPALIRQEIKSTCPNAIEIPDRDEAINTAISLMNTEDIVAIIGKGHETEQIYNNNTRYFSDNEVVIKYLNKNV